MTWPTISKGSGRPRWTNLSTRHPSRLFCRSIFSQSNKLICSIIEVHDSFYKSDKNIFSFVYTLYTILFHWQPSFYTNFKLNTYGSSFIHTLRMLVLVKIFVNKMVVVASRGFHSVNILHGLSSSAMGSSRPFSVA